MLCAGCAAQGAAARAREERRQRDVACAGAVRPRHCSPLAANPGRRVAGLHSWRRAARTGYCSWARERLMQDFGHHSVRSPLRGMPPAGARTHREPRAVGRMDACTRSRMRGACTHGYVGARGGQVITSRVPHGYGEHGQYKFKPLRDHIEHMRVDNHTLPMCAHIARARVSARERARGRPSRRPLLCASARVPLASL